MAKIVFGLRNGTNKTKAMILKSYDCFLNRRKLLDEANESPKAQQIICSIPGHR